MGFGVFSRQLLISLSFTKCKNYCKILIDILVQGFCPFKAEIARFPLGFCLNVLPLSLKRLLVSITNAKAVLICS